MKEYERHEWKRKAQQQLLTKNTWLFHFGGLINDLNLLQTEPAPNFLKNSN